MAQTVQAESARSTPGENRRSLHVVYGGARFAYHNTGHGPDGASQLVPRAHAGHVRQPRGHLPAPVRAGIPLHLSRAFGVGDLPGPLPHAAGGPERRRGAAFAHDARRRGGGAISEGAMSYPLADFIRRPGISPRDIRETVADEPWRKGGQGNGAS